MSGQTLDQYSIDAALENEKNDCAKPDTQIPTVQIDL